MSDEYHQTTGKLPDGLAFLRANRTEFWLEFRETDDPKTASELTATTDYSKATIYRMLDDLEEYGLAESVTRLDEKCRQHRAYRPVDPAAQRVATDGGEQA